MSDKEIIIKGTMDKLRIYPGPEVNLVELKAFFRKKFNSSGFFRGASCRLEILDWGWTRKEKEDVKKALCEINDQVEVRFFRQEDEIPLEDLPAAKVEPSVIKRNFRSGQKIAVLGDLVIIGDINPGAEVIAGGDIIVFGRVAGGLVHAGVENNDKAKIFALELSPTQMRIGKFLGRAPDENTGKNGPEVAKVKNGRIVVEKHSGRGEGKI